MGLGTAAALTVLGTRDPNQAGHYPSCPFLALTGHWCPGCGSLRAIHALLHGDLVTAWERNPLAVLMLPVVVLLLLAWAGRTLGVLGPRTLHPTRIPVAAVWGLLAVVLAYWVLRNVPGWTFLSPA
ncbi:MAG TPA: DUF2752 domain-containing protein [Nocardioides sp.]|nr:DUF2752 domain-containing protein [Nocardioides sp.]